MSAATSVSHVSYPGRGKLWLGLGLTALGIAAYSLQVYVARLTTPRYLPALTTIGAVCCLTALWQQRSIWRVLALMLVVLIAGAQWTFLFAFRHPAYAGPAVVSQQFPSFTTSNSDGKAFTNDALKGDANTVMVFFRGRW
jgi:hypothetical protein